MKTLILFTLLLLVMVAAASAGNLPIFILYAKHALGLPVVMNGVAVVMNGVAVVM